MSQSQIERSGHVQEWFVRRAIDSAGYITLVLGYIISILAATYLTVGNFLAFTLVNIFYAIVAWRIFLRRPDTTWWSLSGLVLLGLLTFASGMLAITGLWFNWLLYFVTVGIYVSLLSERRAIIACVLLVVGAYINSMFLNSWHFFDPHTDTLLPGFVFVAAFSYSNRLLIMQRERTEQVLWQLEESRREREEAHAQLQVYASEVEELTIDRERARMAREIHDTLGHYLTILTIQLETISKLQERDPARAAQEVAEARRVAAQSMQEVRNAVAALRPTSIATLSLSDALTQLAGEFKQIAPAIALTLDLETPLPALSPDLQLALYRVAQEAFTNVRKHAHATKVLLRLRYEDEVLELIVLDNGKGEVLGNGDTQKMQSGFGLLGLRERIELLGGRVMYGSAEPVGYRLAVHVPIPMREQTTRTTTGDLTQGA